MRRCIAFSVHKKGRASQPVLPGLKSARLRRAQFCGNDVQPSIQFGAGAGGTAPMKVTASKKPSFGGRIGASWPPASDASWRLEVRVRVVASSRPSRRRGPR